MAGAFFLHFSKFSAIWDLILLFLVFRILQLASNAKLHLVLANLLRRLSEEDVFN